MSPTLLNTNNEAALVHLPPYCAQRGGDEVAARMVGAGETTLF
ncbi:hypothetical protein [Candidatus Igneacidithiobacillus taiwanensis]|nr:hypothetical protein [Candidatus Igneacidithiobacillus taiwanensis]